MKNHTSEAEFALGGIAATSFSDADPNTASKRQGKPHLTPEAELVAAALSHKPMSRVILSGVVRLCEFILVVLAGYIVNLLYVDPSDGLTWRYALAILGTAAIFVGFMQTAGGYSVPALRRLSTQTSRLLITWTLAFVLMTAATFLAKFGDSFSRIWFASWFVFGLGLLVAFRAVLSSLVGRWIAAGLLERRAVIVGGGERAEKLISALKAQSDDSIRICGIFDDRGDDRSPATIAGCRKLGTIDELVEFGRRARIDLLIVALPITAENRVLQLLKKLCVLPVDICLSAHTDRLRFRPRTYSFVGKVPFFDVVDKPIADWDVVIKWAFDHIVGGIILLLALPVMAAVALAVKLDSRGPVLFKQKRYGFNNELIEVYKFRSMYVESSDANASKLVTKNDSRVTRVGRFIRKTSLDELPQLFNVVFKNNLSLVGPRPHAVQAKAHNRLYDEVVDIYFARHRVKPGITGWAQVSGWRGETDTEEKLQRRVEHDLYYIENWSVLFDLYILAVTPFSLLSTESAY